MNRQNTLIFQPAEILLPAGNLRKWSVIACDQFTSDGEYWEEVERFVGDAPSALRLMLPEYYLGCDDESERMDRIQKTMLRYLNSDVFRVYPDSLVYLERQLSSGSTRRGLVGVIDLEAFDFSDHTDAPIRASEHTVEDRLPPRIQVRREACLEMPHIMLFFDDPNDLVMQQAESLSDDLLYDYDLMDSWGIRLAAGRSRFRKRRLPFCGRRREPQSRGRQMLLAGAEARDDRRTAGTPSGSLCAC